MSGPVTWGVISTAGIATTKVVPSMQKSSRLTVSAACSRDAFRAGETASELGVERSHGSHEALLADPDIAAETLELPAADRYRLQAEMFGEAVREGTPLPFPIEDALGNMRVIDALFASARSQGWERP